MESSEKVREVRLRRMAERQGLVLHKSSRRDPNALSFGRWAIVASHDDGSVAVANSLSPTGEPNLDLDEVEAYLTRGEEGRTDEEKREAEAWVSKFTAAALRADPDANIDLVSILASAEIPERFMPFLAEKAVAADVRLVFQFVDRFGSDALEGAVSRMREADQLLMERILRAAAKGKKRGEG